MHLTGFLLATLSLLSGLDGQVTLPSYLANKEWQDSDKGIISFSSIQMNHWTTQFAGCYTIDTWEAYWVDETAPGQANVILRSPNAFTTFQFRAYLCLEITKVSDVSYVYYQASGENSDFNYERIRLWYETDAITDPWVDICLNTTDTNYPEQQEYHMLIRKGQEINAMEDCNPVWYGMWTYGVFDSNSIQYCSQGNETWDACSYNNTMTFDYNACPFVMLGAENGQVGCLYSMEYTYAGRDLIQQTVFSRHPLTGIYTFACTVGTTSGRTDQMRMTAVTGSCVRGQSYAGFPSHPNGTVVGYSVSIYRVDCVPVTTDSGVPVILSGPLVVILSALFILQQAPYLGL